MTKTALKNIDLNELSDKKTPFGAENRRAFLLNDFFSESFIQTLKSTASQTLRYSERIQQQYIDIQVNFMPQRYQYVSRSCNYFRKIIFF